MTMIVSLTLMSSSVPLAYSVSYVLFRNCVILECVSRWPLYVLVHYAASLIQKRLKSSVAIKNVGFSRVRYVLLQNELRHLPVDYCI